MVKKIERPSYADVDAIIEKERERGKPLFVDESFVEKKFHDFCIDPYESTTDELQKDD